jgi:hypothetical protein
MILRIVLLGLIPVSASGRSSRSTTVLLIRRLAISVCSNSTVSAPSHYTLARHTHDSFREPERQNQETRRVVRARRTSDLGLADSAMPASTDCTSRHVSPRRSPTAPPPPITPPSGRCVVSPSADTTETNASSDAGRGCAAAINTRGETAKLNPVDPLARLADMLVRLQDHPAKTHRLVDAQELEAAAAKTPPPKWITHRRLASSTLIATAPAGRVPASRLGQAVDSSERRSKLTRINEPRELCALSFSNCPS